MNVLERRYDVVCTNPPYLSIRNMNPAMGDFLKRHYKKSKGDLYSAFIERCAELTAIEGRLAMITQQSFMFISTFENLREILLGATAIETMAHVGPRAFAEVTGEKVNTTVFVLRREQLEMERREARGVYFRLVKEPDAESKRTAFELALARRRAGQSDSRVYEYRQGDFADIPGSPWVYWCTTGLRQLFRGSQTLGSVAEPRQGLATADNFRFIRYWWEVGYHSIQFGCTSRDECKLSESRWYPHVKGGGLRRWHGNQELVINYGQDGRELKAWADPLHGNSGWSRIVKSTEFYFREGVTWSALGTRGISARYMAPGFVIGPRGPAVFSDGNSLRFLLGVLNSKAAVALLSITSPTIMFEVGQLRTLPVPARTSNVLIEQVMRAVEMAKHDSREDETSYDFVEPPPWSDGATQVTTATLQRWRKTSTRRSIGCMNSHPRTAELLKRNWRQIHLQMTRPMKMKPKTERKLLNPKALRSPSGS